jgi:hypothetical protein
LLFASKQKITLGVGKRSLFRVPAGGMYQRHETGYSQNEFGGLDSRPPPLVASRRVEQRRALYKAREAKVKRPKAKERRKAKVKRAAGAAAYLTFAFVLLPVSLNSRELMD